MSDPPVNREYGGEDAACERWPGIIERLEQWRRDPSQLDEEGIETPSAQTIQRAIEVAKSSIRAGRAAPKRVVPDAHGGIVFERFEGNVFETIRVFRER